MNIYIVEESINKMGGVERIVSTLANHFIDKNNVNVISMYKNGDEPFFKYDKKIERLYLWDKEGVKGKLKNRINYLLLINRIRKFCKSINDDDTIIFGRVSVAVKFLPYIKSNPKIIVRDAINLYNNSRIVKILMKKYFPRKVNTFIVSSDESMKIYKDFWGKKDVNMVKIYNPLGIKTDIIEDYKSDNNTILSVGRFDSQKGFENVINAFGIISKKYPDWRLKIVGGGELFDYYSNLISELGLNGKAILLGSSKQIEEEYKNASIFVMTSRYEGYANALVEALACGVPCISFDWLTGVDDIIDNKHNGLIVNLTDRLSYYNGINNMNDVINLADAMKYLIENKDITMNMSKEAKNIVKSRDRRAILKKWDDLIYGKK